jgi:hypothetical protein
MQITKWGGGTCDKVALFLLATPIFFILELSTCECNGANEQVNVKVINHRRHLIANSTTLTIHNNNVKRMQERLK